MRKLKIGNIVIIKDGQNLSRSKNPKGTIKVQITEIYNDVNGLIFDGKCLNRTDSNFNNYSYELYEIIGYRDRTREIIQFT